MSVWTEAKAYLPQIPDDWSRWIVIFEKYGLDGTVQTDQPPTLSAYFAPGDEAGFESLRSELLAAGAVKVDAIQVPEEEWSESWKQFFKPRRVGNHLVIQPTWEQFDAEPTDLVLVLDPGQAFGTGDHPTTRGCLELLESMNLTGMKIADIGCGSGILSVAAMKLGAASVTCVDTDLPSVESTLANAARNNVCVQAFRGRGFAPIGDDETFDIVVSNIISAAIIGLAPDAAMRVRPGGAWIVSGIIQANWPEVQSAGFRAGFTLEQEKLEGEWIAALFRR